MVARNHRDQVDAIAIGQAHVGEAQRITAPRQQAARLGHRGGAVDIQTHADQGEFDQFPQVGFVIDDQHTGGAARRPGGWRHNGVHCRGRITKALQYGASRSRFS